MDRDEIIKHTEAWTETEGDNNFEKHILARGFMIGVFSLTNKKYWEEMLSNQSDKEPYKTYLSDVDYYFNEFLDYMSKCNSSNPKIEIAPFAVWLNTIKNV